MVNYIFQSSHLYQRKQETSARKLPGCFDLCYLSRKSSSLLCESVQIRLSSKYGCALRVFVPTSFFQLLLEHILFPTENCFVKRKKVKNVMKLLPPHYFKHLMSIQFKQNSDVGFLILTDHFCQVGFLWTLLLTTRSQTFVPHCPFPIARSPFPVPRSPFHVPRSPLSAPRSRFTFKMLSCSFFVVVVVKSFRLLTKYV